MTQIFYDGWETGDNSQWTGTWALGTGYLVVQSTVKYSGTYALEAHSGTRTAGVYKNITSTKTASLRLWVRPESGFGTVEGHGANFCALITEFDEWWGNKYMAWMGVIRKDGVNKWRFSWWTDATGNVNEYGEEVTLGQWYLIRIEVKIGIDGYYKFYINNILKKSVSADNRIDNLGIGEIDVESSNTRLGFTGDDRVFYHDDAYIYNDAYSGGGSPDDSWIKSGETVLIFDRIFDISMEQNCDIALRDVPLRTSGEVMDTGTYFIHTLTLKFTTRLSDSEKTTLETIYEARQELNIYLQLWTFTGWFRKPDIVYEYETNRPWLATLTFDIYTYSYSGSSVGTFSNQQLRLIGGTTLDYENIIDFSVSKETSVAIPEWVNQDPSIDTNIWNKELKRMIYIVRETEYRLYKLLQILTAHTAITFYDYIHGPTNKTAWLSSVRATWNPLKKLDYPSVSFIDTPWEVEFEVIVQE